MTGLTPIQARALDFITKFIAEHRWSPTYAEIADGLDLKSRGNTKRIVEQLAKRGLVKFTMSRHRSVEIIPQVRAEPHDFLPHELKVWVGVVAAKAGFSPLDVITECVRDAYTVRRNTERSVARGNSEPERAVA